jgi:hypothetical protein
MRNASLRSSKLLLQTGVLSSVEPIKEQIVRAKGIIQALKSRLTSTFFLHAQVPYMVLSVLSSSPINVQRKGSCR